MKIDFSDEVFGDMNSVALKRHSADGGMAISVNGHEIPGVLSYTCHIENEIPRVELVVAVKELCIDPGVPFKFGEKMLSCTEAGELVQERI